MWSGIWFGMHQGKCDYLPGGSVPVALPKGGPSRGKGICRTGVETMDPVLHGIGPRRDPWNGASLPGGRGRAQGARCQPRPPRYPLWFFRRRPCGCQPWCALER